MGEVSIIRVSFLFQKNCSWAVVLLGLLQMNFAYLNKTCRTRKYPASSINTKKIWDLGNKENTNTN